MSTSMINGSPLKAMLRFAMPLLFGNLLQQTYNIIDAAIVGQVLEQMLWPASEHGSSVQFLVLGFCMGITAGFGIPVAKFFGSGQLSENEELCIQRRSSDRWNSRYSDNCMCAPVPLDPEYPFCTAGHL